MTPHLFALTCTAKSKTKAEFPDWFATLDSTDQGILTTWVNENATGDPYHHLSWMSEYIKWQKTIAVYRRGAAMLARLKQANQDLRLTAALSRD
jgi:hypothetical protein